MSLQAFVPTHLVPAGGLAAYERADPSASVVAQLEPNLDVAVLERLGDWSHIACSNGWGAWVDGRRLVPRAASSTASTPMPLSPALAGAGIIAIGALLPWVRGAAMATGNAFHLPVSMLWSSPRSTTNGPFDLWLLLAAAVGRRASG